MYADCLIPLSVQKKTFCCTRDTYKTSCTENGVVVYAALIMAQENLPRPYHRKERPFWKSASANRPGPGFCPGKIGKAPERRRGPGICPAQGHRRMARLASPHQRTGAVAGLCSGKVGKRLPEGPHKRRGGASASCRRQRSSGDARRRHRRSPCTRTPPNGLTKKCSSEHRRGRGTLQCKVGKRLPEGPHKRRGGASARCRRQRCSGDARRRLAEPTCP